MEWRVGSEQTRCRVACAEGSFVLDFFRSFFIKKKRTSTFIIKGCILATIIHIKPNFPM